MPLKSPLFFEYLPTLSIQTPRNTKAALHAEYCGYLLLKIPILCRQRQDSIDVNLVSRGNLGQYSTS